ncbi:MAG: shikimate dehydrogenase [Thermodesulfobacteriota bacterium]|nr:shikimate dehydrogenase [Thermodesulfobacteriota bacterium]
MDAVRPVHEELYAVIGHPVAHSLSPAMMRAAFAHLGYPAVYLALDVASAGEGLDLLYRVGFQGLSVTIPHKESALGRCVSVDEGARAVGAVNTVRRTASGWEGRNTDWLGAVRALQRKGPLKGRTALVIGAGGAARGVVYGLMQGGAALAVTNRSPERGQALARGFDCDFVAFEDLGSRSFDLVVQTTSVGMTGQPDALPLPPGFFRAGMTVMDIVYRPLWTRFLKEARDAGCETVTGLDMLLYQGMAQLEWWTGLEAPEEVMRRALEAALEPGEDPSAGR